jgi:hypothetical protein
MLSVTRNIEQFEEPVNTPACLTYESFISRSLRIKIQRHRDPKVFQIRFTLMMLRVSRYLAILTSDAYQFQPSLLKRHLYELYVSFTIGQDSIIEKDLRAFQYY